jgi:hypothetical protein
MPKRKEGAKEILKRNLRTKKVYHYVDPENDIDIKSKEVFKKVKKIIHYPFRPQNGAPKYLSIRKIIYEDLDEPLPKGFLKKCTTGYGFKRELNPLLYSLEKAFPQINQVIVSPGKSSYFLGRKKVIFKLNDLSLAIPQLLFMLSSHKEEQNTLANNILSKIFPDKFSEKKAGYKKGQLNVFIRDHALKPKDLSKDDIKSISKLFSSLSPTHEFVKKHGILTTKESVDKIYIEDILERFKELYAKKTNSKNLESKWQEFFSDNILYFNFGYIELFEKDRIQGDISIEIPDFTLLNTYGYLDVFEIKTHLTQLLSFDSGRKNFYWSSEAGKAISQAENYIDAITKEEYKISKNILDEYGYNVNAVRPTVYIIAGTKEKLAGEKTIKYQGKIRRKLNNDFRRLNNSLKNITFVLYDELLEVFQNTLKRLRLKVSE